jgi:hypothetical protein
MENLPDGFFALVKKVMKEQPLASAAPKNDKEIWEKFLRIVFLGGSRSDAEINYLLRLFGSALDLDYVLKTKGEALESGLSELISGKMKSEKNPHLCEILKNLDNELFRIIASLKGAARYFERTKMGIAVLNEMTKDREKTQEFIHELVEDEDVTNVKFIKVILWLHSVGKAGDFAPPSRQIKDFCNKDVGPYYRFYEDDKYFMEKMQEISGELKKEIPKATVYDVSKAAFYYRVCKGMLSGQKGFAPSTLMKFLKKEKTDLNGLAAALGDLKKRELLAKKLNDAYGKR